MKIDCARCSLVIAGSWNVAIFSPGFVSKHIFRGPEVVNPEMTFSPEGLRPLYSGPYFNLMVHLNRTIWQPRSVDDDVLQQLENAAVGLLNVLAVTPISAVGMNFGFDIDEPDGLLRDVLELPDMAALENTSGTKLASTAVRRSMSLEDDMLNLAITRDLGDIVKIDLNFHKDVTNASDALKRLGGSIRPSRDQAFHLLDDWYGLLLEGA